MNKMHFQVCVILLQLFSVTVPINQYATNPLGAARKINVTQSNKHQIRSTSTIVSETCNDGFCYNLTNETANAPIELTASYNEFDRLKTSSVLYGIVKLASERDTTQTCYRQLNQIYDGIHRKQIWAIKALDSSAMPESGFVHGNNFWLGNIKGCKAIQTPPPLTISKRFSRFMHSDLWSSTAPFDIDYRLVYAEHRSPWQVQVEFLLERNKILHVGLCLPISCSKSDIANLTQTYFDSQWLDAQMLHDFHPIVVKVKDFQSNFNWMNKNSVKIIGFCVVITLLLMFIAYMKEITSDPIDQCSIGMCKIRANVPFTAESQSNQPDVVMQCANVHSKANSFVDDLIECYSLRNNFKTLTNVKKAPNAVPIIDGIKSIGCVLIMVFHVSWFNYFTVQNPTMVFSYGERAIWQWISAMPIMVDVFFTISGILLSYNFLRNRSKIEQIQTNTFIENCKLFAKQVLHRYLRLTPMYLMVAVSTEFITSQLVETSPFWIHDRNDLTCQKYWWRNVFYIQNLFNVEDLCINWSWSLACEMQFFILFTAVLFLYAKYPNVAKAVFCSLFGIFFAMLFTIAIFIKFTPSYDVLHALAGDIYVAPWARILPYLVGVGAGYTMFLNNGVMPLNEKAIKIIWAVMFKIAIISHVSTLYREISYLMAAPLITFIRLCYPISISWMVIASHSGHGGLFAKVLNSSIFIHLNKLSYGIYLLNPIVIITLYGLQDHTTQMDPISMSVMTVGINVTVYLTSVVFSIMFEIPYTKLSTKILKQESKIMHKTIISMQTEVNETKKSS